MTNEEQAQEELDECSQYIGMKQDRDQKKQDIKKPRGRPVKNVIEPIDATLEELARAICRNADRKLAKKRRIKI